MLDPPEESSPDIEDIEIPFDTSELETSSPAVAPPPPKNVKKKTKQIEKATKAPEKSTPAVAAPKKTIKAVLSSEGDDWSNYMDDLASSQERRSTPVSPGSMRDWEGSARASCFSSTKIESACSTS